MLRSTQSAEDGILRHHHTTTPGLALLSMAAAQWDVANKGAGIVISNGGHTVSSTIAQASDHVYGNQARDAADAWYADIAIDAKGTGGYANANPWVGIASPSSRTAGNISYQWGSYGYFFFPGGNYVAVPTFGAGDILRLQVSAGSLRLFRNGADLGVIATGLSGLFYLAANLSGSGDQITTNFGTI
jgi:hypothetical protein